MLVYDNFDDDLIGGDPGDGNIIAFNRQDGVNVYGGTGHEILSNSIHSNGSPGGLGSILQDGGVTHGQVSPNDPDDADGGPNGSQNFPVLASSRRQCQFDDREGHLVEREQQRLPAPVLHLRGLRREQARRGCVVPRECAGHDGRSR